MSNPYKNNQSWGQQQGSFGPSSQTPQMKEFDFTAMSGAIDDPQSRGSYTYHPSQLQLPSSSGNSSATVQSTFPSSTPQSRSASFGTPISSGPIKPGSFGQISSNSNPSQNMESYGAMFSHPSPEQLPWNDSNSFSYQRPILEPSFNGSSFNGIPETTYLSSSPSAVQDAFPQQSPSTALPQSSQYSVAPTPTIADPRAKRTRNQTHDNSKEDEPDAPDAKETAKAKAGACARCKNLKVRCEFKTDTDPCKRCLNGGHDCIIPGRKKRRTPPKREHLLNQIREQAAQIKDLMAQLESTGARRRRPSSAASDSFASPSAQSPVLSPSTTNTSFLSSEAPSPAEANTATNKAVEDWIAKAKQSFEEFDVFIGIGGAGMPKSYLVEEDLEHPESDEDEDYVNLSDINEPESDYEFAIENHDGEDVTTDPGTLRHKGSSSSLSTNGTGVAGHPRKKHSGESAKPAILPGEAAPFGLFGDLSLKTTKNKRASSAEVEEDDKAPGIANTNFFRSTPAPEAMDKRLANIQHPPQILTRGIITPEQAEELFQIYFDRMNLSVSLLDPVLYTATRTLYRSPFLFTVICAIASRFYSQRPGLYQQVMHYAQQAAAMALISGPKNVEMCQAYILLSLYPVPAKRWEDQRSWMYLGLAIRIATDLNLHLPNTAKPKNELHAREMLNRTRCWLNCFNLDRSTGSQYGKPPIISSADYMANHSENWWESSEYNMKNFDIQICAYNAELKVMAGFLAKIYSDPDHPTGLNKNVDFEKIATETDDELKRLGTKWMAILETTDMTDPQNRFRTGLLRLAYPYARLIALSYGFQHAFGKNNTDENPFLTRCLDAAFDVVLPVLDDLCVPSQKIYLRHGPEAQSVFITFASAFLVKLLQPKFNSYLTVEKRLEIREVVQRVVDLLSSPEIAIDDRHGPKLYAKFLKGLLAAPMALVDRNSPPSAMRKGRASSNNSHTSEAAPDTHDTDVDRSSQSSASPAPRQEALSFDSFAVGALDPYAQGTAANTLALHLGSMDDGTLNMSDFFQPSLPFDDAIMQSIQSLADPNGWHDTTLPSAYTWNPFQQPLNVDYRPQDPIMYESYMTGVQQ
ncbi:putative fungal specific transcription factor [Lyophyllum shimeji]|uniref:Fungal specific transcription factor n=1 Tax=Lyophyllum shimeji TaxID=47721 RepID=A0A9P3PQI0_LYOSH|nr:putative fungal specific transcription factor [Lyophyllum shimeji]